MLQTSEHQHASKLTELEQAQAAIHEKLQATPKNDPSYSDLSRRYFRVLCKRNILKPKINLPNEDTRSAAPIPMAVIGARTKLSGVPYRALTEVQNQLRIKNPKYLNLLKHGNGGHRFVDEYLEYFEELSSSVVFPRGYTRQALAILRKQGVHPQIEDRRRTLEPIVLTFQGELRGYQESAVQDVLRRHFGVLSAATGSGKTIMALSVIAARQQPTLILVHTKELLNQWADQIQSFLGIEAGVIGGGKFDLQPVTVATIQTARKHIEKLREHFGFVIGDEIHRVPALQYADVIQGFDSKFMLGLSATPYRRDGLSKLIYILMGDRVHQVDPQELKDNGAVLTPKVIRRETAFQYQYQDDYPQMLSALTQDRERNEQIAHDVIRQAQSRPGACLVVSDRVQHCQDLAGLMAGHNLSIRVLTGKTKPKDREAIVDAVQAGTVNVLVSTVQLLGEGFDCSGLSSLFLAAPMRFDGKITQVVGRILRPADGKWPVVFDYVDHNVGVLKGQSFHRARTLKELSA